MKTKTLNRDNMVKILLKFQGVYLSTLGALLSANQNCQFALDTAKEVAEKADQSLGIVTPHFVCPVTVIDPEHKDKLIMTWQIEYISRSGNHYIFTISDDYYMFEIQYDEKSSLKHFIEHLNNVFILYVVFKEDYEHEESFSKVFSTRNTAEKWFEDFHKDNKLAVCNSIEEDEINE